MEVLRRVLRHYKTLSVLVDHWIHWCETAVKRYDDGRAGPEYGRHVLNQLLEIAKKAKRDAK